MVVAGTESPASGVGSVHGVELSGRSDHSAGISSVPNTMPTQSIDRFTALSHTSVVSSVSSSQPQETRFHHGSDRQLLPTCPPLPTGDEFESSQLHRARLCTENVIKRFGSDLRAHGFIEFGHAPSSRSEGRAMQANNAGAILSVMANQLDMPRPENAAHPEPLSRSQVDVLIRYIEAIRELPTHRQARKDTQFLAVDIVHTILKARGLQADHVEGLVSALACAAAAVPVIAHARDANHMIRSLARLSQRLMENAMPVTSRRQIAGPEPLLNAVRGFRAENKTSNRVLDVMLPMLPQVKKMSEPVFDQCLHALATLDRTCRPHESTPVTLTRFYDALRGLATDNTERNEKIAAALGGSRLQYAG
jgi:hypothetical protein